MAILIQNCFCYAAMTLSIRSAIEDASSLWLDCLRHMTRQKCHRIEENMSIDSQDENRVDCTIKQECTEEIRLGCLHGIDPQCNGAVASLSCFPNGKFMSFVDKPPL
jgi:hypothetical protein